MLNERLNEASMKGLPRATYVVIWLLSSLVTMAVHLVKVLVAVCEA